MMESAKMFQGPRLFQTFSLLPASIGFLRVLTPSGAPVFSSTSPLEGSQLLFSLWETPPKKREMPFWEREKLFTEEKSCQWPEGFPFFRHIKQKQSDKKPLNHPSGV